MSIVSNSLWPHGLYSPWNSPGQNTGVGSLSLLQGVFPTQDWTWVSHIADRFFFFNINLFILIGGSLLYNIVLVGHTSTWIFHGCTHVPHPETPSYLPSLYHPSGSSQCTSPKHPVSCIEPGLADSFHIWYYTCLNAIFLKDSLIMELICEFFFCIDLSFVVPLSTMAGGSLLP